MTSVPTIEVKGPAGKIVINAADLDKYRAKGYRPVEETGQESKAEGKALDDMKIDELKKYAADNNIDIEGIKLKPDILAAIKEAEAQKANKDESQDTEAGKSENEESENIEE
jgi:predicted class III extradiol MEMO1 family dioxygenase